MKNRLKILSVHIFTNSTNQSITEFENQEINYKIGPLITKTDIVVAIKNLNNNQAQGLDTITNKVIENFLDNIIKRIQYTFKKSIELGYIPKK